MKRLPDKMSDLLKLALGDEAKAERSPKYTMDMDQWHEPEWEWDSDSNNDVMVNCNVCFAGAVISFTLGGEWGKNLSPEDYMNGNVQKLHALDKLRRGNIYAAAAYMKLVGVFRTAEEFAYHEFNKNGKVFINDYMFGRVPWRRSMFRLVGRLARAGL